MFRGWPNHLLILKPNPVLFDNKHRSSGEHPPSVRILFSIEKQENEMTTGSAMEHCSETFEKRLEVRDMSAYTVQWAKQVAHCFRATERKKGDYILVLQTDLMVLFLLRRLLWLKIRLLHGLNWWGCCHHHRRYHVILRWWRWLRWKAWYRDKPSSWSRRRRCTDGLKSSIVANREKQGITG